MPITEDEWLKIESAFKAFRNGSGGSDSFLKVDVINFLLTFRTSKLEDSLTIAKEATRQFSLMQNKEVPQ
jgi:hypothetical protein